ncbi:hypothetical protein EV421DRAFT_2086799 [Armillaria borealis]|uniref:Uncharacterized protein n=1 Tax=Armillaria borealis TaxID=47425 RepID=A0AA39J4P8_9AGAR|nr:hypothetical protein EV421DRAFT_2086799 [Armillaria borealis]
MSSHVVAVELLRWSERYCPYIPCVWRLCRFCRVAVEDEQHALYSSVLPLPVRLFTT